MSVKSQRPSKEQVRSSILMTARDIAAHEGWPAVTVRKIAERIGYTAPIIYEHFGSKNDMLTELLKEGYTQLSVAIEAASQQGRTSHERLHAIAYAYWDFAHDASELYRLMYGMEGAYPEGLLRDYAQPITAIVSKELIELNPNRINEGNVAHYMVEVWSVIHGLTALSLAGLVSGYTDKKQVLDELVTDILYAIANNNA